MAYTFGAATTDNIAYTSVPVAPMSANKTGVACCWVRPTTLTANRALWASGASSGCVIAGTTSSVVFIADATTDLNVTIPVGLAVNTWSFVAIMWNLGAATVQAVRGWSGTEQTGPVEQTPTTTSTPVGSWVSSGTTWTVGNATAGSLSFQGDIGGMVMAVDSQNSTLNSICAVAANGTISNDQANAVRQAFIDPIWRGDLSRIANMGRMVRGSTQLGFALSASLDSSGGAWAIRAAGPPSLGTVGGATVSALRTPHGFTDEANNRWSRRRSGILARAY